MAARETLDQLLEQKKTLEDRIQRRLVSERKKKVNQILAIMRDFEISIADIEAGLKEKQSRPQYRNPKTGAVWGGVGKRPKWIVEAQEKGIDIKKFLVTVAYNKKGYLKTQNLCFQVAFSMLGGREMCQLEKHFEITIMN